MTPAVIFGAGGLGRVVHEILLQERSFRPVAFLDSDPAKHGERIEKSRVRGGIEQIPALRRSGVTAIIVAIGDSPTRVHLARTCRKQGMHLISAIHPLASISSSATLDEHLIVGARAIVCVHATVGGHCVLSTGSIVEHDNVLGTGVFLHPAVRLAGGVEVEDYATLGIGACVIPYRRVGRAASVEPGGVVIRDVLPGTNVGGVPATRMDDTPSRFVPEVAASYVGQIGVQDSGQPSHAGHEAHRDSPVSKM